MQHTLDVITDDRALTAESPVWAAAEGALYWIDTWRERIHRLHLAGGTRAEWSVPSKIAAVGLRENGGLVVAMKSGIAFVDKTNGAVELIVNPDPEPGHRLNDGKVDRAGRLWFGSMEESGTWPDGKVYRFSGDRRVAIADDEYILPNGPCWSPDDRLMYLADSRRNRINVYDFDLPSGEISNRRTFADVPGPGVPDGATTDAEGALWSACSGGGAIVRYLPGGEVAERVELPVSRPTSVMFGGDDLRTLFITTASARLSDEELAAQPLAGKILAIRTDVPGLPEPLFKG